MHSYIIASEAGKGRGISLFGNDAIYLITKPPVLDTDSRACMNVHCGSMSSNFAPPRGWGGHSGIEGGGRTRVTYFAEEGVSACPRFCKRRALFCTQVRSMRGENPLTIHEVPGGGGHSGTEGGRTRVTYFAEEGVFFQDLRMSAIL